MSERSIKGMSEKEKSFYRGYICCLSNLVQSYGTGTESYQLFEEIGSPSAKFVRDLGLGKYDREAMNELRRQTDDR